MYWHSVAGRNLALRKTKKVDNYIKSKSNALRADDVRVLVNGSVSELDLFGLCSGANPQLQVGVVDINSNIFFNIANILILSGLTKYFKLFRTYAL